MGPSFEFSDFKNFINLSEEYKNITLNLCAIPALTELFKSILNILSVLFFMSTFDSKYLTTEEFGNKSIFYKFVFYNISMLILRTKYYAAWKMSQSAVVFSGLSYNPQFTSTPGVSGDEISIESSVIHKFDKVENVVIREVEFDPSPKRRIQYWNRTVHLWLKYNVFMRLLNVNSKTFKNNKGMASLITFMISAFWHGFYPVYYLFFALFYIIEQTSGILDEDFNVFKYFDNKPFIVKFAFATFTQMFCNYLGIIFCLITFENVYQFTKNIYFIPPVVLCVTYYFLLQASNKKKRLERKEKEIKDDLKNFTPGNPLNEMKNK